MRRGPARPARRHACYERGLRGARAWAGEMDRDHTVRAGGRVRGPRENVLPVSRRWLGGRGATSQHPVTGVREKNQAWGWSTLGGGNELDLVISFVIPISFRSFALSLRCEDRFIQGPGERQKPRQKPRSVTFILFSHFREFPAIRNNLHIKTDIIFFQSRKRSSDRGTDRYDEGTIRGQKEALPVRLPASTWSSSSTL